MKTLICSFSLLVFVHGVASTCPEANLNGRSVTHANGNTKVVLELTNTLNEDVEIFWVDQKGKEVFSDIVSLKTSSTQNTFPGHLFRGRVGPDLVFEYAVDETLYQKYQIKPCGKFSAEVRAEALFPKGRDKEFAKLVDAKGAPCAPANNSALWSCVRHIAKEALRARDKARFGFQLGDGKGPDGSFALGSGRVLGMTMDNSYVAHIPHIVKLTQGSGFLKMRMPPRMWAVVKDFYQEQASRAADHGPIAGYYSNEAKYPMTKIDLDLFSHIRASIVSDMRWVLQWWTRKHLKHTSTFGIRIYHRNNMLINHVDRADTHLASAVLQIAQNVDEGWPLEVMSEDGEVYEVYLQPGEMVLYEGARLFHGRPMRFNGTDFGNIFTHFAPVGWNGPHQEPGPDFERNGPARENTFLASLGETAGPQDAGSKLEF